MADSRYAGIAYITLDGDQIQWINDKNQNRILLNGSHFHDVIPVATLSISALCLLLFVIILWEYIQRVKARNPREPRTPRTERNKKYKYSVGTAMLCMILFFATDLTNRIEHELERVITAEYIAIDIPMGCLSSIADGLLLVYLLARSPVDIKIAGSLPYVVMIFAFAMYWLISFVTKGAQIWNVITQFTPNNESTKCKGNCNVSNGIEKSLQIEQDLDSAATGMLLLFSIGYALFSISYIHRLPKTLASHKRLSISVGTLATAFLARNTVDFAFTLIYSQFDREASLGIQLVYLALWGLLSVGIYTSVVFVEATLKKGEPAIDEPRYQSPQGTDDVGGYWQREKPQVNVGADYYPSTYRSYPYYHGNAKPAPVSEVQRF